MNHQSDAEKGYLDIIFEGRNKLYGGYELRTHYPQRIRNAFLTLFCTLLLLAAIGLFSGFNNHEKPSIVYDRVLDVSKFQPDHPICPPTPSKPKLAKTAAGKSFTLPKIVTDDKADQTEKPALSPIIVNNGKGAGTVSGDSSGVESVNTANGLTVIPKPVNKPIDFVEQPPVPGYDLMAYIQNNLKYPEQAKEYNTQGRVVIRFVINEDGSITQVELVHGIGSGCDEEALRVIAGMPKWKPGKQAGKPVKVYFTQPVTFRLE